MNNEVKYEMIGLSEKEIAIVFGQECECDIVVEITGAEDADAEVFRGRGVNQRIECIFWMWVGK